MPHEQELTTGQRAATAAMALWCVVVVALTAWDTARSPSTDLRSLLAVVAVVSFVMGVLCHPAAVRGDAAALDVRTAPRHSQVLFGLAVAAMVCRGVLGLLTWF